MKNNDNFGKKNARWDADMWTETEKTQWLGSEGSSVHYSDENGEGMTRCLGCMELYSREYDICPNCGSISGATPENPLHMFPGTYLRGRYIIGKVIGSGGFGITYIAWDTVLKTKVAIKEYLPSEFSTRASGQSKITVFTGDKTVQFADGKDKFVDEAKRLAKFQNESGIVKIFDSFEENNTAYIVMEFLDGETLAEYLERNGKMDAETAIQFITPVIESLNSVHEVGIIHRDVAPDNIFVTKNGDVKLIDFGASRYATTSKSRSLSVLIKPGYSAEEQYRSRGDQGAHTDVYSLAATLYKMITGVTPPDALERRAFYEKKHKDILEPITKHNKEITDNQEAAIYNALNIKIEDRTPDTVTFLGELTSEQKVKRKKGTIKKIDPLTWPLWLKIAIPAALVVFITLGVLLTTGVIGPKRDSQYRLKEGYVRMPSIVNKTVDEAQDFLDSNKDENGNQYYFNIVFKETIDSSVPYGTIFDSTPASGKAVKNGTESSKENVFVVISLGRQKNVASALGVTFNDTYFPDFEVIKDYGDFPVKEGCVYSQSQAPNTKLAEGEAITVQISTGPADPNKRVTVKNVEGKTFQEALAIAKEAGFYIYFEEPVLPESVITTQSVKAGTTIKAGEAVLCSAKEPEVIGVYIDNIYYINTSYYYNLKTELENEGFTVDCRGIELDGNIDTNKVIKITYENGEEIEYNSEIPYGTHLIIYYNTKTMAQPEIDESVEPLTNANAKSTTEPEIEYIEPPRNEEDPNEPSSDSSNEAVSEKESGATTEPTSEAQPTEPEPCTVIFVNDGVVYDRISVGTGTTNVDTQVSTPIKDGYTFVGWTIDDTNEIYNGGAIYSDTTLNAKWEARQTSVWVTADKLPEGAEISDTKTQYQKETVTWVKTGTTSVEHVDKWPSGSTETKGFKKSEQSKYSKALPVDTATKKYEQTSKTESGYLYWHWCYSHTAGEILNCPVSSFKGDKYKGHVMNNFDTLKTDSEIPYIEDVQSGFDPAFKYSDKNACPYTYWWIGIDDKPIIIYTYKFDIKEKRVDYSWTDTYVEGAATRTMYKYYVD